MCLNLDLNQSWPGKLSYLSDKDVKNKFAWRLMRFKDPFLGFEDDLEFRKFKLLTDPELKETQPKVVPPLTEDFYKEADFTFFMNIKYNMYEASVQKLFNNPSDAYKTSIVIDANVEIIKKEKLFLDMYVKALKKRKKLEFHKKPEKEEDLSKKALPLSAIWSDNKHAFFHLINEKKAKNPAAAVYAVLFPALGEKKKKKDELGPINDVHDMDDLIVYNQWRGVDPSITIDAIRKALTAKTTENDNPYWTEDTIPYFVLNYNTGTVDYDFWNNTDERVAKRIKSFEDFKAGVKTLSELKSEELEITLPKLRGLFGIYDYVLLRQFDFNYLNVQKTHLPYFMQIYNWFQTPAKASNYNKTVFGLIGPTLTPHWCLVFTMTKTRKNIYFTISDMVGKVLLTVSAGSFNITRKKRMSPHALEPLYTKVLGCLKKVKIKNVILVMKFRAKYMYLHTLNFFRSHRISVKVIIDRFPVPHNGIRSRKKKRL